MFERYRKKLIKVLTSRVFVLSLVLTLLFATLVRRVFVLQIIHGQEYMDEYSLQIKKTKSFRGTRGNIYDSKGELLAYNRVSYTVTIEDTGSYKDRDEKNKMLNAIILKTIYLIELNGNRVDSHQFGVELRNDAYVFAEAGTRKLRFLADVYGYAKIDKLTDEQRNVTAEDLIKYMCSDPRYGYGIDQNKLDPATVLKLVTVRYQMSLNNYQKYISTSIAEDVNERTVAAIKENKVDLTGVDVSEQYVRKYNDAKYFSPIIGYTGDISTDEYEALIADGKDYDRNDVIGKTGLEQSLDEKLQGGRGEIELAVDNTGRVLSSKRTKTATAGQDVYLTIDRELQIATYKIIEEKLAGIIYSRLIDELEFDRRSVDDTFELKTPIGDVYYAFFDNEVLDMDHLWSKNAERNERSVASIIDRKAADQLASILKVMKDPGAKPYSSMSVEMQNYLTCMVDSVLDASAGIIVSMDIDQTDEMVRKWEKDESVNAYDYLNYLISKGWIDTAPLKSYLGKSSDYSDASQIYSAIIKYLADNAATNRSFRKIIVKYLIRRGDITGQQACMMLYEQGVLKTDDDYYADLSTEKISPYDFLRDQIRYLTLTPGQIGIEPCSASAVVTDVKTGKILACVSYPGYNNNRLSNIMDNAYYKRLSSMSSSPLYNKATQVRTAPGSTYKMMSSITGLTENAIDTDTMIYCRGEFTKVDPPTKCWVYPSGHGALDVVGALQNSCNYFFNTVGYNLGLKADGTYSSDLGIQKLREYARGFGLGEKSGIEITESQPKISDTASVPSAMGQGTNNYTTTQLARYVQTVANSGDCYKLTLVDHVTDSKGKTIDKSKAKAKNDLQKVKPEYWDLVHQGMRNAAMEGSAFMTLKSTGFEMAGKTGTAQQSAIHPDHGLFVGYAPYKEPEIAMAIRITNGYSSSHAAEIGCSITRYRFKLADERLLITGSASGNLATVHGD